MKDNDKIFALLIAGFVAFGYLLRYDYVGLGDKPAFLRIDRVTGTVTICPASGCN